jgi:3-deoxy-D-manno-octulosonate 8-phosphate phosphatase (KDO 8-P phosphatase)
VLGCDAKREALDQLCAELEISRDAVACAGDDSPDLEMLEVAGLAIAVADAHPSLSGTVHWRTSLPGGHGAVREICDLIISARHSL